MTPVSGLANLCINSRAFLSREIVKLQHYARNRCDSAANAYVTKLPIRQLLPLIADWLLTGSNTALIRQLCRDSQLIFRGNIMHNTVLVSSSHISRISTIAVLKMLLTCSSVSALLG